MEEEPPQERKKSSTQPIIGQEHNETKKATDNQPQQLIQIFVSSTQNSTISFAIKEMLTARVGIPADHQRLRFCSKQMNDPSTLQSYGVQHGSTLGLLLRVRCTESFLVKTFRSDFWLPYDSQMLLSDVKQMIASKTSTNSLDITLKVNNHVLEEGKFTLSSYKNSGHFITIHAEWALKVTVRRAGTNDESMKVQPSHNVKSLIEQYCTEKALDDSSQFKVLHGGIRLQPYQQFSDIPNIERDVIWFMPWSNIIVRVIPLQLKPLLFEMADKETVSALKSKISSSTGLSAKRQILINKDRQLTDREDFTKFSSDCLVVYLVQSMMHRN